MAKAKDSTREFFDGLVKEYNKNNEYTADEGTHKFKNIIMVLRLTTFKCTDGECKCSNNRIEIGQRATKNDEREDKSSFASSRTSIGPFKTS